MALLEIVPDQLWHATQLIKLGPFSVSTRMTVVRLADASLWIHSPIYPERDLRAALSRLGVVAHVVAPNNGHHLFFADFLQAFPLATGYVSPTLANKRPELAKRAIVGDLPGLWPADFQSYFIAGLPQLDETIWYHRKTQTLVLTDLLTCFGDDHPFFKKTVLRLLNLRGRLGMSPTLRLLIRDREAFANSVSAIRSLPVQLVIVAHEEVVEQDAAVRLDQAFDFLAR